MPAAITSSANPFADVVDARDFNATRRDHAAESRRFADALDASRREPSRKLERLPPDEPLADHDELPPRSDDVALRHDRLATLRPQQPEPSSSSSEKSSSSAAETAADKGRAAAIDRGRRLRDGTGVHSSGRIVHTANAPSQTSSTKNAAGADALFDAVQRHVHASVHREAQQAERRTEKLGDVFSEKRTLDDDKKPVDASAAPVETETARSVEAVAETSTTMTTTDGTPTPVDVGGPRESAALDHVQQVLEDPASQLFFDGRRAVISLDGMTMRVTTTAEGQTSVELRSADAAIAERLQAQRSSLVEGLQQEGLAPAAIDFGHHASSSSSSSSSDRRQQHEGDGDVDVDVDDLPWRRAAVKPVTSAAAPPTSRGIKA
ncbi:MAG TPA: hypothetical protein VGF99_15115 [Myxococcota bacterium]